jgi:hypothetical protein
MPVRIPVVISQSERRGGAMAEYEEQLITQLIFENGLDATLISDLKSISIHTTDHLCIEGLKGDFALACWDSPATACEQLHRLGIPSLEIFPVDGSPGFQSLKDQQLPKKIFFIPLSTSKSIDSTIQTLRELREARSIPVFSLAIPISKTSSDTSTVAVPGVPQNDRIKVNGNHAVALGQPDPKVLPTDLSALGESIRADQNKPFLNIDALMDDLDKFEM